MTIVTVSAGDELHGMTATSFASVSLDPPLVLVCLEETTRTHSLVVKTGAFVVNVLADHQQSIARVFSQHGLKRIGDLPHRGGQSNAPVLDGANAWVECSVYRIDDGGDHHIVFGEVIGSGARRGRPLLYWNCGYRFLSPFPFPSSGSP